LRSKVQAEVSGAALGEQYEQLSGVAVYVANDRFSGCQRGGGGHDSDRGRPI
jgi:hypothetical protein